MSDVKNIINQILQEAREYSDNIVNEAKTQAKQVKSDYEDEAEKNSKETLNNANMRIEQLQERARASADMNRRKMILASKQEVVSETFEQALKNLAEKPDEERALFMVKMAIKYQTQDAELIFNKKDQKTVAPSVINAINTINTGAKVKEILSKSFMENIKSISSGKSKKLKVSLSTIVGDFCGGFILKEGNIENNCTFEVLVNSVRDELEGDTSSILFN